MKKTFLIILSFYFLIVLACKVESGDVTEFEANYEEDKVPAYTLPDPLISPDQKHITNADEWRRERRKAILSLFEQEMYGKMPPQNRVQRKFELTSLDTLALDGAAIRKEVTIHLNEQPDGPKIHLLCYLPPHASRPVPAFVGLNFYGNQTVHSDTGITITNSWVRNNEALGMIDNRATEASRGVRAGRWPVELILSRGYALVTAYYGDIDPDFDDDFQNGIHPLFYKNGQIKPDADEWGSIAAWAWGLSQILDYIQTDPQINGQQAAVFGHSRLGKASLWAGARDERFAMVISNNSGCGGAALSRRGFGETVERINQSFPHWFSDNFQHYNRKEEQLPVDQHMLLALIAPRPLYVASALEDQWADPKGEFLSAVHATPVYQLLGEEGLPVKEMPAVDQPVVGTIGYHIRSGKHDVTTYDWQQYLDFADRHFEK